jgi:sugar/nucleoside kinase (ribokinase family)
VQRVEYDVLVIGRPSWDLVFTGLPKWPVVGQEIYAQGLTVSPGGTFNTVAALARLNARVGMIGSVGNDEWSGRCLAAMQGEGVSTELMAVLDEPMPAVSVCMTYDGDRGFISFEPSSPDLSGICVAHALSSLKTQRATFLQCCLNTDLAAYAQSAHGRGMKIIVDCGWDEPWLTGSEIRTLMPRADVVFMNELEALTISGKDEIEGALDVLGNIVRCIVVKRGSCGSSAVVDGQRFDAPAVPAEVVDATGAGDCFNAGFIYGLLHERPIAESLMLGNICGACAVGKPGGYAGAPTEPELLTRERQLAAPIRLRR